jgi:hypothetical protein
MSLSNTDIEKIAKDLCIPIHNILMKDELKNCKKEIGNYIINLQSSSQGFGTHWTALIIRRDENFFFDSFGALPCEEIIDFIKPKKLYHNNWIIQDLNSSLCGWYCIGLLKYIQDNKNKLLLTSANDYINMFEDDTKLNSIILKDYLYSFKFRMKKYLLKSI